MTKPERGLLNQTLLCTPVLGRRHLCRSVRSGRGLTIAASTVRQALRKHTYWSLCRRLQRRITYWAGWWGFLFSVARRPEFSFHCHVFELGRVQPLHRCLMCCLVRRLIPLRGGLARRPEGGPATGAAMKRANESHSGESRDCRRQVENSHPRALAFRAAALSSPRWPHCCFCRSRSARPAGCRTKARQSIANPLRTSPRQSTLPRPGAPPRQNPTL